MKPKYIVAILVCLFIVFSVAGQAARVSNITVFSQGLTINRIILSNPTAYSVSTLERQGCRIRHKLKGMSSFECPKSISISTMVKVNAKPAEVYHLLDLRASQTIRVNNLWNQGYEGSGVNVILLDTGIDTSHPELRNVLAGQWDFVNNDPIADDANGHGTMVAGMLTGNGARSDSKGVAPKSKIYMLKVCNKEGVCMQDDIQAALEYVERLNARIVSISLGSNSLYPGKCDFHPMAKEVNELANRGYIVVVAAGNAGYLGVSAPGCASGAIAVGAVNSNRQVTWWSSRGSAVDVLAPGAHILSSVTGGGYGYMDGTSAATPQVAGVVALLWEAKPTATSMQIKNALLSSAQKPSYCYHCSYIDRSTGRCLGHVSLSRCSASELTKGVVNAGAALRRLTVGSARDSDMDGTPDNKDLCPNEYGKACNGCPNNCHGCAVMECRPGSKPSCNAGSCPSTHCPSDGCGKGGCQKNQWADFPGFVTNTCRVYGSYGYCTHNSCLPSCSFSSECSTKENLCWAGSNKYLTRSSSNMRKFCECVTGSYRYLGYKRTRIGFSKAYKYRNARMNSNFATRPVFSYNPVYMVKCSDRQWHYINQDYYN